MEKRKKKKFNKRITILIILLLLIIVGILFLLNNFIPVNNINGNNIEINLSTTNLTGKNVTATISTKTHYDIFYFIDYTTAEEQYYEDEELSEEIEEISDNDFENNLNTNTITNSINTTNSVKNNISNSSTKTSSNKKNTINIKQISDKEYKKLNSSKLEIENNGIIFLKYGRFGKLSSTPYVFEITNIDKEGPEIGELETSSTSSTITVTANAIDTSNSDLKYYFRLASSTTYISTDSKNTYTFTDLTADESYTIYVKVADKFGNESEAVTEATASINQEIMEKKVYHFKVNIATNTVTVYEKDNNGKFTQPVKVFICSTGKATPKSGTYKISDRYRWRSLFGGVYGQYAVRIYGNILFHSVPYEQMYPNTLEYEEYDKLGTSASMGCVRLCVKDAKWIYDNAKVGSSVEFYSDSSNPGPLGKPKSQKISDNKANRNWDPTDPDKHNPWLGGDGSVTKVKIINDDDSSSNQKITNSTNTVNTTNDFSNNTLIWNTTD